MLCNLIMHLKFTCYQLVIKQFGIMYISVNCFIAYMASWDMIDYNVYIIKTLISVQYFIKTFVKICLIAMS